MVGTRKIVCACVLSMGCYSAAEQEDIDEIQSGVTSGNAGHDDVMAALADLQADMDDLQADVAVIDSRVLAIETEVGDQTTDLSDIADGLTAISDSLTGLDGELDTLSTDLGGLVTDLGDVTTDLDGLATDLGDVATDLDSIASSAVWTFAYGYDPIGDTETGSLDNLAQAALDGADIRVNGCATDTADTCIEGTADISTMCLAVIVDTDDTNQGRLVCVVPFIAAPDLNNHGETIAASISFYLASDGEFSAAAENSTEYVNISSVDSVDIDPLRTWWYVRSTGTGAP